ncbi:hypothetical protein R3W88_031647 [Solanum pinnatisectum]|uniref:Uncharacterized protein n=1 Tax=Solanum pinnatisectum TaxID=50273 RepID=A0AAV9LLX6_9SOLN|nr:hypothetical protein R3W88_031647 [Solanum pinnatisectum]
MLHVLVVRLLPRLDSAPNSSICPGTASSPITVGVRPQIQGPSMGFQTHGFALVPSLALMRFAGPLVSSSVVILLNLDILEAYGVSYTSYQFFRIGRDQSGRWWTGGPIVDSLMGRANQSYAPSSPV